MLRLRPFKPCDAEKIVSWIPDEHAFYLWSADRYGHYPITAADMNRYYANDDQNPNLWPMTAFDESGVVGHLIMRFTDAEKKVLRFGFIIVDLSKRGKGYGKAMIQLAAKYAFEIAGAEKITLGVFADNPAAYHCYLAAGFHEVPGAAETYRINGEDWECLELEWNKE